MSQLTCGHIQLVYSIWWMRLLPETCRVKPLRRIKTQLLHLVGLISLLKRIYLQNRSKTAGYSCLETFPVFESNLLTSSSNTPCLVLDLISLLSTLRPSKFFGTIMRCNITVSAQSSTTQTVCKSLIQIRVSPFTYGSIIQLIFTIPIIFNP